MTGSAHGGLSCVARRGDLRHRTRCGVGRFATTRSDDVPLAVAVPLPDCHKWGGDQAMTNPDRPVCHCLPRAHAARCPSGGRVVKP
jgi:hypothetical protein